MKNKNNICKEENKHIFKVVKDSEKNSYNEFTIEVKCKRCGAYAPLYGAWDNDNLEL